MHGDEYRARNEALHPGLTLEDLRRQVRESKARKGFDITLEHRLAYVTSEVGEAAEGVPRLSRNGNSDVGTTDAEAVAAVRERLGEEIYDLADLAGVGLEGAFEKRARRNEGREW